MRTVQQILRRPPVSVSPSDPLAVAAALMREHRIPAIPVIDSGKFCGMLLYADALGEQVESMTDAPILRPDMAAREAVDLMTESGIDCLPVMNAGQLLGLVTALDLLPEVKRSCDPLTDLAWSDDLREWAAEQLSRGNEITILFLDLDGFREVNKREGHVAGDEVLKSVARTLEEALDPQADALCRYGGDEFCIASLRTREQAGELADALARRIQDIGVAPRITCSIGLAGGRRATEREGVHLAATVNSLIDLASRDCMAQKPVTSDQ